MLSAWELLVNASVELDSDLFRYDLVDITKEVLQYKFASDYIHLMGAFNRSDLYGVRFVSIKRVFLLSFEHVDSFKYSICYSD